jgi:hypothetical protein
VARDAKGGVAVHRIADPEDGAVCTAGGVVEERELVGAHAVDERDRQTRRVARRPGYPGYYNLSTHFPWIGRRTAQLEGAGAYVGSFRGILRFLQREPLGAPQTIARAGRREGPAWAPPRCGASKPTT